MPYLLFLKKQQNFKLSSAANYRLRFIGYVYASYAACKFMLSNLYFWFSFMSYMVLWSFIDFFSNPWAIMYRSIPMI